MAVRARVLAVFYALAITACVTTTSFTSTSSPSTVPASSTTTDDGTTITGGGETTSTMPGGTEELPEALRAEIGRLIGVTEEVRGLEFVSAPTITVVSDAELAERVRSQIEEDYEDVDVDQALYILLGLVEPDFDLRQTVSDLYGEQVAGFYDGETEELVVPAREDEFTIVQQVTLIHELTHSLTDQVLDFHTAFAALHDEDRFDQASAFQALIEGDASLTEIRFVQQLGPTEQQQFLREALEDVETTVFDGVPAFIQDSLLFPYETGFGFVSELFEVGGLDAVDEAYANPPVSTEQVIDPDRYPTEAPLPVGGIPAVLEGYELAYGSTWGELGFRLILDQALGESDRAATGWGGDSYNVFFNGTEAAMVLRYVGDSSEEAGELYDALRDFVATSMRVGDAAPDGDGVTFTGDDYAFLARAGEEVVWVVAGDPTAGGLLRSQLTGF